MRAAGRIYLEQRNAVERIRVGQPGPLNGPRKTARDNGRGTTFDNDIPAIIRSCSALLGGVRLASINRSTINLARSSWSSKNHVMDPILTARAKYAVGSVGTDILDLNGRY
jgi:hypothetical protein